MYEIIETNTLLNFTEQTCEIIYEKISKSNKNEFNLLISGGNTPPLIFSMLVEEYKDKIPWEKINIYWVDERYVDIQSKFSNYFNFYKIFSKKIIKFKSINRIETELSIDAATNKYFNTITKFISNGSTFDLSLLGMGEDGHVASIFETDFFKPYVYYTKEYYGFKRITVSLEILNLCKFNLLIINNKKKLNLLKSNTHTPIHFVRIDKIIFNHDV
jgi:6-phosphogluconolactonase